MTRIEWIGTDKISINPRGTLEVGRASSAFYILAYSRELYALVEKYSRPSILLRFSFFIFSFALFLPAALRPNRTFRARVAARPATLLGRALHRAHAP